MAQQGDEILGRTAVERGWITVQQLGEALAKQVLEAKPLSEILVSSGFLTAGQVQELTSPVVKLPGALSKDLPIEVQQASQKPENNVGDLVLVKLLGVGGMGKVFLAWEKSLRRYVAVKFVTADANILREAQASAKLEHESIIPVYKVEHKDPAHIVMKYVEGDTLNKCVLSIREKVKAIRDASLALAHAHAQGIIHRDIKPQNIMIERASASSRLKTRRYESGDGPRVYVMDFGLARLQNVDTSLSASGAVLGTPQYMPPEQAMGRPRDTDERSDVYSLGATLYHLLTGVPPFTGEAAMMVLYKVIQEKPKPMRSYDPNIPIELEQIVEKCLEKKKERRYQKAEQLAEDLDKFLLGAPLQVDRVKPTFGEWVGEHSRAIGLLAILMLAVIASAVILLLGKQSGPPAHDVSSLVFSPNALHLAAASKERSIVVWRVADGKPVRQWVGSSSILTAAFSPDSKVLAAGAESGALYLWDWETEAEPRMTRGHSSAITCLEFRPDGKQFITAGADGTIKTWDAATGYEIQTLFKALGKIRQISTELAGNKLVAVTEDGSLATVDLVSREGGLTLRGTYTSACYSTEGDLIAAGRRDGSIQILREKDGSEYRVIPGHTAEVGAVRFSTDGRTLLSGGADKTIRAWDYRKSEGLMTLTDDVLGDSFTAMSADGTAVASGGRGGQVKVWKITSR